MNEIYVITGKTKVLTSRGYEARIDILGYAAGNKEDILKFYKKGNERYIEMELEKIEVKNIRNTSKIEELLEVAA